MTEAQAIELVAARFIAAWPGATSALLDPSGTPYGSSGVPYALPNEARLSADVFVQVSLLPYMRQRISQGGVVRYQQWQYVIVSAFVPANSGAQLANQLADAARAVYEKQSLALGAESVTIDAGTPRAIAAAFDNRWYVKGVQFLCYWFESR